MSASHPMCRSYSSESQKKDWSKRLSLRGNPRSKEVRAHLLSFSIPANAKYVWALERARVAASFVSHSTVCARGETERKSQMEIKETRIQMWQTWYRVAALDEILDVFSMDFARHTKMKSNASSAYRVRTYIRHIAQCAVHANIFHFRISWNESNICAHTYYY